MPDIAELIADLKELEAKASTEPWNEDTFICPYDDDVTLSIAIRNALPILLREFERLEHVERLAEQRYEYIHSLGTETEEGYDLAKYLNALLAESAQEIERRGKCAEKAEAERDWLAKRIAELVRDVCPRNTCIKNCKDCWLEWAEREAAKKESEGV